MNDEKVQDLKDLIGFLSDQVRNVEKASRELQRERGDVPRCLRRASTRTNQTSVI